MPGQVHVEKTSRSRKEEPPAEDVRAKTVTVRTAEERAEKEAELDELVDEIDDLLAEVNAETFVREYVQKGGQ